MRNTISNLTQTEFDTLFANAQIHRLKEDIDMLRDIVRDYCTDNIMGNTKESLLKLLG